MDQDHVDHSALAHPDAEPQGPQSIRELIRGLASDLSTLFTKELALAKAEIREAADSAKAGMAGMAVGAGMAMAGLIVLMLSAVYGLANVVEPWLAALIVGVAALIIAFILLKSAQKKIEPAAFVPEKTMDSLQKDKETVKRAVQ